MKQNVRFLIIICAASVLSTQTSFSTELPVLIKCALNQKVAFSERDYLKPLGPPLPLSKSVSLDILIDRSRREIFVRGEKSSDWLISRVRVNPDFYISSIEDRFKTHFDIYIDRKNLSLIINALHAQSSLLPDLSDTLKSEVGRYGNIDDSNYSSSDARNKIKGSQFLGECKILLYEPKI